jgi:hypothetical protein
MADDRFFAIEVSLSLFESDIKLSSRINQINLPKGRGDINMSKDPEAPKMLIATHCVNPGTNSDIVMALNKLQKDLNDNLDRLITQFVVDTIKDKKE